MKNIVSEIDVDSLINWYKLNYGLIVDKNIAMNMWYGGSLAENDELMCIRLEAQKMELNKTAYKIKGEI